MVVGKAELRDKEVRRAKVVDLPCNRRTATFRAKRLTYPRDARDWDLGDQLAGDGRTEAAGDG